MIPIYLYLITIPLIEHTVCANDKDFDVFLSQTDLYGKSCKTEHTLFAEDGIRSEVSCVMKCKFQTNCRSVFYKSSDERCEFCSGHYENGIGLLDDQGTSYYSDTKYDGNYLLTTKMNYTDTKIYCESRGGYILQVDSSEENEHIADLIGNITGVWLGYTDIATEGVWVWERPELATNYTNWKHLSGPLSTVERPNENCAALLSNFNYGWGDRDCSKFMTALCEF